MKTTYDVMNHIYKIINVAAVTATLTGKVYRNNRPLDSLLRDINITSLPIEGGTDKDLQEGTFHVNCFAQDLTPGRLDDANLDAMTTAVVTVLESYKSTDEYLHLEINSEATIPDIHQAGTTYSSIRVDYTIQFKAA